MLVLKEYTWSEVNGSKWNQMIKNSPGSSIYNTWEWIQTIHEAYTNEIQVIIIKNEDEYFYALPLALTTTPFIGKRYISLPYSDFFPIFIQNSLKTNLLLDYLINNWNGESIQVRDEMESTDKKHVGYYHTLDLSNNIEVVFQNFDKKQIQQRIKNLDYDRLKIVSGTTSYFITNLYSLLLSSRTRLNSFLPSKKYFRSLQLNLLNKDKGYISLVQFNGKIIAGGLFLKHKKTVYFRHGASLSEYWNLHPNHFLIWETIKHSCNTNYKCFDFGRTGLVNEGLRNFKSNWGSEEKKLFYSLIHGPSDEKISKATKFRKYFSMPGKFIPGYSKLLSHKLYKYFP